MRERTAVVEQASSGQQVRPSPAMSVHSGSKCQALTCRECVQRLKTVYDQMDKNGDGYLSIMEFRCAPGNSNCYIYASFIHAQCSCSGHLHCMYAKGPAR